MNRLKESYEPKVVNGIYNGALMNLDDVRKSLPNNTPREIWNLYQELFDLLERENNNSAIEKQADNNISDGTFTIYIQSVEAWAKEYKPLEGKTIPIYNVHRITEYEESICGVVGCDYCGEIMVNDYTLLLPFSEKKINSKIPVSYEWINIGFIRRKQSTSIQENKQYRDMKDINKIRINESQINSLLKGTLNESYKDRCKIVGLYAFVQFFKQHPEKIQTLEPKWKERYEELSEYFDEHPLGMEMQAIYRREWPQLQRKQTINEYNGSDAIEDAENSGYDEDDPMYQYILQNGGGGVLYEKRSANEQINNSEPGREIIYKGEYDGYKFVVQKCTHQLQISDSIYEWFVTYVAINRYDVENWLEDIRITIKKVTGCNIPQFGLYDVFDNTEWCLAWFYNGKIAVSDIINQTKLIIATFNNLVDKQNMKQKQTKQTIKLNESQLRGLIKESIKRVLKENSSFDKDIEEIKNIISRLRTLYKESNKRYEELPSALINAQEGSSLSYDTKLLGEAIDILVKYLKHNGAEYAFHQTVYENTKKVLKESNSPIVIGDEDCGDLYSVAISNSDYSSVVFNVYCYSAQDALDEAVDYAENQGWNGLFDDENEEEINEFPDDYITAGNHGHYLRIDKFVVRKV